MARPGYVLKDASALEVVAAVAAGDTCAATALRILVPLHCQTEPVTQLSRTRQHGPDQP